MTRDDARTETSIPRMVEESSIGTAGAQELRRRTPSELAAAAARAAEEPPHKRLDVPEEWITAATAGDRTAVERVLSVIRPLVTHYCRARLIGMNRSSVSADDLAQEVCLAVLTALPGYRAQGRPFMAFVYGIASHKVIDAHRAASRNRTEPVTDIPDRTETAHAGPAAPHSEPLATIAAALAALPAKEREIIILRAVVGLSAEETATAIGSTPGAVRVAQHRALTRLRQNWPAALNALDLIATGTGN